MSAYDLTDCPPDPLEPSRERLRDLLVRDNPGDPRTQPFDPRDQKATRYGWIIVAVCGAVIVLGKLAGVL